MCDQENLTWMEWPLMHFRKVPSNGQPKWLSLLVICENIDLPRWDQRVAKKARSLGCRSLLEMMILDSHIVARKMFETIAGPPAILSGLLRTQFMNSKLISKGHFFANPMSTSHL
ncbi:hypothetical protein RND71_007111 [Anisodus tanguticus]|uniref:Uncharacterized protein n=1 Tax=Anisodus tanguticus TaxID=243964 RepID=A0AAE1SKZ2_9SOLA|nr:hypothetical protein RND71_007111 [Anisodus tanguticus]